MRQWNIMVYVDASQNHFKFWSYSNDDWVAWGRIGTEGTMRQFPESEIQKKIKSKLNKGYRFYAQRVSRHNPNPSAVQRWIGQ